MPFIAGLTGNRDGFRKIERIRRPIAERIGARVAVAARNTSRDCVAEKDRVIRDWVRPTRSRAGVGRFERFGIRLIVVEQEIEFARKISGSQFTWIVAMRLPMT